MFAQLHILFVRYGVVEYRLNWTRSMFCVQCASVHQVDAFASVILLFQTLTMSL
jgi:hypothetical protein